VIAESFWGSDVGLYVVLGTAFLAVFLVSTFLIGTRERLKARRGLAARLGRKDAAADASPAQPSVTPWLPDSFAEAGRRFAVATGFSARLDERLEQAGLPIASGEFVALTAVGAVSGAIVAAIFLPSPVFMVAMAILAGLIPSVWMLRALKKRRNTLGEQLADTLAILASSLRAGYSFLQALDTVSKEVGEPSAGEFQRVVAEIRLGRPIDDALIAMAERIGSEDLKWAVIAINVQRQVGGNLAEVLDIVANTVRERAYIRRQVQVLSADGRLSVGILTALPFGMVLYISVVNPEYIKPMFTTAPGLALLVAGGVLLAIGVVVMRRIIKIDV
jgi:tight adherence protein B